MKTYILLVTHDGFSCRQVVGDKVVFHSSSDDVSPARKAREITIGEAIRRGLGECQEVVEISDTDDFTIESYIAMRRQTLQEQHNSTARD